jgi:hypothetical protein
MPLSPDELRVIREKATEASIMPGLQNAFDYFGVIPKNRRWSVSGRSPDGQTVAMVFWQHRLNYKTKPISYSHFGWHQLLNHNREPSTMERIQNLIWARDHCDGLLKVIIGVPNDPNDVGRGMKEAFPQPKLIMRLVALDEETGEFFAINVGT